MAHNSEKFAFLDVESDVLEGLYVGCSSDRLIAFGKIDGS
jgi:hypothetical protein